MYKFLNPVLIVVYVVFNFCLCIKLIADPSRVIEVKKVLGADDKEPYLKNYHIINNPQAEFDIEVQPKTFWDYILLFNTKENLLSLLFQIIGGGFIVWYFLKTIDNDPFFIDKKNLKWLRIACFSFFIAGWAIYWGQLKADNFWESSYQYSASSFAKPYYYVYVNRMFMPISLFVLMGINGIFDNFSQKEKEALE